MKSKHSVVKFYGKGGSGGNSGRSKGGILSRVRNAIRRGINRLRGR